jgi:AmmeMemoRadiSam system protein B/AmmeMemoRadiSam system protein A
VTSDNIRKSSIAGSWYPDNPRILRTCLSDFFQRVAEESIPGNIIGLLAPHAGYIYSGQVAAYAYKMLQGHIFDAVIIIGPSHRFPFRGVSIYDQGGYETPLGTVPVDGHLADRIKAESRLVLTIPSAHVQEHSIEIQLPFLQYVLGEFSFVPLLMGSQDRKICEELAAAIVKAVGHKKVLVVASSDLSHFHSYDQALKLDRLALGYLEKMDADGFLKGLEEKQFEACGGGPAAVTMLAAQKMGASSTKLLLYANSGDVTGDKQRVVGYGAAVFCTDKRSEGMDMRGNMCEGAGLGLTAADKKLLLKIVETKIEAALAGKVFPELPELPEIFKQERGAFVTLEKKGQLRGCIGYIEARKPLYIAVAEMAVAAAFHDPRFPPLQQEEWPDITVEISILSPLQEIQDIKEIEVGRHGLYIVQGVRGGLLLPQVATNYKWDRLTFLQQTCQKARLPSNAWQDKQTKIFIFSADIIGADGEHNSKNT